MHSRHDERFYSRVIGHLPRFRLISFHRSAKDVDWPRRRVFVRNVGADLICQSDFLDLLKVCRGELEVLKVGLSSQHYTEKRQLQE